MKFEYGVISGNVISADTLGHKQHGEDIEDIYFGAIPRGDTTKPLRFSDPEARELVKLNKSYLKNHPNIRRVELKRTIETKV